MKLILSSPTYGPIEPLAERHLRTAMSHAAQHANVRFVGDASPNRIPFAAARNLAVKAALASPDDPDAILWVDSDIVVPVDGITRMVLEQKPFLSAIYVQREPPHFPLIAQHNKAADTFNWFIEAPENVVACIDGCGFGCVLTSMEMFRTIEPPWFEFKKFSEDFDFALKAKAAGFQLWVHTGVKCGHLRDPVPATWEDFVALRDSGGLAPYLKPTVQPAPAGSSAA